MASYDSKDLVVLEGLDAVRMRPGMYIGTTGVKGLHHLLWEIIDNAIDEVANGFGNKVEVTLHKASSPWCTTRCGDGQRSSSTGHPNRPVHRSSSRNRPR